MNSLISSEKATLRALSNTMDIDEERTITTDYFEKETMIKLAGLGYFRINEITRKEIDFTITFRRLK